VRKTVHRSARHGSWTVVCFLILAAVVYLALRSGLREARWPRVQGSVESTRVIVDRATETNWGSRLRWRAEYRVVYTVAGREYTVLADSGIRDDSEDGVRLRVPRPSPPCWVKYNPRRPEIAVADCR